MSKIIKKQEDNNADDFKKSSLEMPTGSVVSKRVIDAKDRADEILEAAKKEVLMMHKKAEDRLSEVENIRKKAYEDGFAKGEADALATVTEKIVELKRLKAEFCEEAEPEIIKLVMSIAEKVIGKTVTEHPHVIVDVTKQALQHIIGDRIVIRIHPADYQTLVSQNLEIRDELDRTKRLIFKEDETVTRGGCIVDTEVGTIDAQIETQLAAIRKALGL